MDNLPRWYLLKHEDGETFGPVPLSQLLDWAQSAQISPLDKVSNDGVTWNKAPTVPELEMDWLVTLDADQYYGPTTIGTIREFLRAGEISQETTLTNCATAQEQKVRDLPTIKTDEVIAGGSPGRTGIRQNLQQRIRDLERALLEERRLLEMSEERYRKLEARFLDVTGRKP